MSRPPQFPYPPDPADGAPLEVELEEFVDVVATDRDWAGRRALRISARRVELRRCRLTGAEPAEAVLRDVTFDECRVDLVGLRHAKLERVVFRECRMDECDLYGASLTDVRFERCGLRGATLSAASLHRVELRSCDLSGLRGAEALRGAQMPWSDVLENAALLRRCSESRSSTEDSPCRRRSPYRPGGSFAQLATSPRSSCCRSASLSRASE